MPDLLPDYAPGDFALLRTPLIKNLHRELSDSRSRKSLEAGGGGREDLH